MTEAEFAKEVRSLTLSGIYFLYGDEDYLKNHYIRDACEKFVSSDPMASFNLIRLDYGEGECRLDEIENALRPSYDVPAEAHCRVLFFF